MKDCQSTLYVVGQEGVLRVLRCMKAEQHEGNHEALNKGYLFHWTTFRETTAKLKQYRVRSLSVSTKQYSTN